MNNKIFSTTLAQLILGTACATGAFIIGTRATGQVQTFEHSAAAVEVATVRGDVNGDGFLNTNDITMLLEFAEDLESPTIEHIQRGDINNDGSITVKDVLQALNIINTH